MCVTLNLSALLTALRARIDRRAQHHVARPRRHARPDHASAARNCRALGVHVRRQPDVGRLVLASAQALVLQQEIVPVHRDVQHGSRAHRVGPVRRAAHRRPLLVPRHQPCFRFERVILSVFDKMRPHPAEEEPVLVVQLIVDPVVPGVVCHVVRHAPRHVVVHRLPLRIRRIVVRHRHPLVVEVVHRMVDPRARDDVARERVRTKNPGRAGSSRVGQRIVHLVPHRIHIQQL